MKILVLVMMCSCVLFSCTRRDTSAPAARGLTVRDDLGRTVTLPRRPLRIISLAPSLTEALFALGAGDRVVGVTTYCNYPERARSLPRVGDLVQPRIETIVSMQPDVIVISVEGNTHRTFTKLEQTGIPLFVSNPRDVDGILHSLRVLGALVGEEVRGKTLADSLARAIARSRDRHASHPVRCLMLVSSRPVMAAGETTFLGEMLRLLGARNTAAGLPGAYPVLSREVILELDPDLLFIPGDLHVDRHLLLEQYPEWKSLACMRPGNLITLDADIFLRPGPRVDQAVLGLDSILTRWKNTRAVR